MTSLFITGTGTGVGKTLVTAGLAGLLRSRGESVCVYKPIQTGAADCKRPDDLETVKQLAGVDITTFCSYCFPEPSAPYAADKERIIRPRKLLEDFKRLQAEHDHVLVEGAGGVRVPIARHFEMLDLIRMLQLPVLVVAHPYLGTLNHTLLTVDALLRERLEVPGIVVSGMPEASDDVSTQSVMALLETFSPVPVLGVLPVFQVTAGLFSQPEALRPIEALGLFPNP